MNRPERWTRYCSSSNALSSIAPVTTTSSASFGTSGTSAGETWMRCCAAAPAAPARCARAPRAAPPWGAPPWGAPPCAAGRAGLACVGCATSAMVLPETQVAGRSARHLPYLFALVPLIALVDRDVLLGVRVRDRVVRRDVERRSEVDRSGDVRVHEAHRLAVRKLRCGLLVELLLVELIRRLGIFHILAHWVPPSQLLWSMSAVCSAFA